MSSNSSLSVNHLHQLLVQELVEKGAAKLGSDGLGRTVIDIANVHLLLETYQDAYVAHEVFLKQLYAFRTARGAVVLDIGMNVAIASLYFAQMEQVEHIYGYELFEDTYRQALRNLLLNPMLAMKITANNQGVWHTADSRVLEYNYEWKASLGLFCRPTYLDAKVPFEAQAVQLLDATHIVRHI